jgi:hypothetical protein
MYRFGAARTPQNQPKNNIYWHFFYRLSAKQYRLKTVKSLVSSDTQAK